MSKGPDRDVKKWDRWRGLVGRQARSGQSVRAFCREHGLGESAFYFWRRQLASETRTPDALRRSSRRTGRGGSREVASVSGFVPVEVTGDGSSGQVEVQLESGVIVRIHGSVDDELITTVLSALMERASC